MIDQHIRLFPTHIFTFQVQDHRNEAWLEYIQSNGENSRFGKQTAADLQRLDLFQPLVSNVLQTVGQINQTLAFANGYELEITSMWGQILASGQAFYPHTHANNFWSGVYYVATPGESATNTIEFFDPRAQASTLVPRIEQDTPDNFHQYQFTPPAGWGLIFPSWLQHWVPPVNAEGRCSISWNILMRGEYERQSSKQWANI